MPEAERGPLVKKLVQRIFERFTDYRGIKIAKCLAHHPDCTKYWTVFPSLWEQSVFFTNFPFLKTRVHMSLMPHPGITVKEADYSYFVTDQGGKIIARGIDTLMMGQTHTFDLEKLTGGVNCFGTFSVQTAEKDLLTLRMYASWFNENGMTTTHEKKAYANKNPMVVYPTIVADPRHDTYIAIANTRREEPSMEMNCFLMNSRRVLHPKHIELSLPPGASCLLSIASLIEDANSFLKEGPGALYVRMKGKAHEGMFYYFIHNKQRNTWQGQHL